MTVESVANQPKGRTRLVGKVHATIVVSNVFDEARADDGELAPEEVRTLILHEVLVDTGSNMLCLPGAMIRRLGLRKLRDVNVATAVGEKTAAIYRGVSLSVEGRVGTFECLETPGGEMALLGVIPLEALGIELDLQSQRLILLPERGNGTYITVLEWRIRPER
jgi:predicted aspartyl protease